MCEFRSLLTLVCRVILGEFVDLGFAFAFKQVLLKHKLSVGRDATEGWSHAVDVLGLVNQSVTSGDLLV